MTADSCSALARVAGEPLAGTAPAALTWVVVEHPGPWGRDALADADLPRSSRDALVRLKAAGVGVLLGRPAERTSLPGHPRILLARTAAGGSLLREGISPDLVDLTRWDPEALAAGHLPAFGTPASLPVLLVCTQGRRDACCAVQGRELLRSLLQATSDHRPRIWESSHIGGHRFAPVTLSLPSGDVHGQLRAADGPRLSAATFAGEVMPLHLRGRTHEPPPLQAACAAVRTAHSITAADDLHALRTVGGRVLPADARWQPDEPVVEAEVRHVDGRAWRVVIQRTPIPARPESCGGESKPGTAWSALKVSTAPGWR